MSDYIRIRYEVLFDVWMPDVEQAEFASILCRQCGFLAFEPRPDGEDIERKYRYLSSHHLARNEAMSHAEIDRARSEELYGRLSDLLPERPVSILDYGGGTGGMMQKFLEAGHECSVVDYVETTIPGVQRLGASLVEIPPTQVFDVIICSHVLEHLHDFVGVLRSLTGHLSDVGILYVEVPQEVWDGVPLPPEPVTHINFFTVASLRVALERSGLMVDTCVENISTFEGGQRALAIIAFSRKAPEGRAINQDFRGAAEESRQLIFPPFHLRWKRFLRYPELRNRAINSWGRRYLPRKFFWRFFD